MFSLRNWWYCVIKVLAAEPRSKKRSGDEAFGLSRGISLPLMAANSHSTGTAAPPPNLTRLVHNTASYAGYTLLWNTMQLSQNVLQ